VRDNRAVVTLRLPEPEKRAAAVAAARAGLRMNEWVRRVIADAASKSRDEWIQSELAKRKETA
jgi:predicted HicB family RNase H-like nuclease